MDRTPRLPESIRWTLVLFVSGWQKGLSEWYIPEPLDPGNLRDLRVCWPGVTMWPSLPGLAGQRQILPTVAGREGLPQVGRARERQPPGSGANTPQNPISGIVYFVPSGCWGWSHRQANKTKQNIVAQSNLNPSFGMRYLQTQLPTPTTIATTKTLFSKITGSPRHPIKKKKKTF